MTFTLVYQLVYQVQCAEQTHILDGGDNELPALSARVCPSLFGKKSKLLLSDSTQSEGTTFADKCIADV